MKEDLKGKWAVVTGASSGIGEAYARLLAARGVSLFLTARRTERLTALAAELKSAHPIEAECLSLDLEKPEAPGHLFEEATAKGREISILINNAGFGPYGSFLDGKLERHRATLAVDVVALTELCYRYARHMLQQKNRCYLVNVASVAGFQGTPKFAVYSGAKSFVRVFSEILRHEMKGTNVTVSCLCPGATLTEFVEHNNQVLKRSGRSAMMTAEAVARAGIEGMIAGRSVIVPGVLNKAACFLPRFFPRGLALRIAETAMNTAVAEAGGNR